MTTRQRIMIGISLLLLSAWLWLGIWASGLFFQAILFVEPNYPEPPLPFLVNTSVLALMFQCLLPISGLIGLALTVMSKYSRVVCLIGLWIQTVTITLWAIYLIGLFFWQRPLSLDVVSSDQAFLFAFGVLSVAVVGLIAVWYFLPRNRPVVVNRLYESA